MKDVQGVRCKDVQGVPGTHGSLFLRFAQVSCALVSLCIMARTEDFSSITAFCFLVAAIGLQSLWSLSTAAVDIYALLGGRSLQRPTVIKFYLVNDLVTSTLTYCAASATLGIKILLDSDMKECTKSYCLRLDAAAGTAFLSSFLALPSFLLNLWALGSRF